MVRLWYARNNRGKWGKDRATRQRKIEKNRDGADIESTLRVTVSVGPSVRGLEDGLIYGLIHRFIDLFISPYFRFRHLNERVILVFELQAS